MKNGVKILMAFLVCVAGEFLLDGSSERLKLRMTKVKEWKNKE